MLGWVNNSEAKETVVDLGAVPGDGDGVVWSLTDSEDVNANLVRLTPGAVIGNHVNTEVDVVFVVLAGSGTLVVGGRPHRLDESTLAHVPRSTDREVRAGGEGLTYVTLHRRRGPLTVGPRPGRSADSTPAGR